MTGIGTVSNGGRGVGVGASGINVVEPPDYSQNSILIMLTTRIAYKISYKIQNIRIRESSGNIAIKFKKMCNNKHVEGV